MLAIVQSLGNFLSSIFSSIASLVNYIENAFSSFSSVPAVLPSLWSIVPSSVTGVFLSLIIISVFISIIVNAFRG